jgi:alpha-1,2-mannosyltransferase
MPAVEDERVSNSDADDPAHVAPRRVASGEARWVTPVAFASAGLAAVFAAYPLTFPHMLAGVHGYASGAGYDDGVYLTVALRLVNGALPYRDFVFVHPPGIALMLSPLAALGHVLGTREVLVLARIATVLVVAANSAIASLIVRHHGMAASVTAGVLLAGFPGAYNASHTLLLEPWLVLPCLLAFLVLFPRGQLTSNPRRLVLAGLFGGFAGTVKLWAIFVILPLLLVCVIVRRRRSLPFVAGLATGFVVPCLPFIIAAPQDFVRDVLIAQADRSSAGVGLGAATRIGIMSGVKHFGEPAPSIPVVALGLLLAAAIIAVLVFGRRRTRAADWTAAGVVAVVVAGLFLPGQFYDHYAYFSAAFISVLAGVAAGLVSTSAAQLAEPHLGQLPARLSSAVPPVAACLFVVLALPRGLGGARDYFADATDPRSTIAAAVPAGACVIFDDPVLLIVANRLGTPGPGCPRLVDPFGLWLTEDHGALPRVGGPFPQPFVNKWSAWLEQADYAVLSIEGSSYVPFSRELIDQFNATYHRVAAGDHAFIYAHIR